MGNETTLYMELTFPPRGPMPSTASLSSKSSSSISTSISCIFSSRLSDILNEFKKDTARAALPLCPLAGAKPSLRCEKFLVSWLSLEQPANKTPKHNPGEFAEKKVLRRFLPVCFTPREFIKNYYSKRITKKFIQFKESVP